MVAYYNEYDPFAAAWLQKLIAAGHIASGVVDTRSIEDVAPDDLKGFTQCHFFAGIGVWSYALRRAGWADDRSVWTGSCPCQPFSAAGKGNGFADERHLWPAFFHLIEQCGPAVVLGEQVASKDGLAWLDLVRADVEGAGGAFGAADLCAAGFGAPHIRQRSFWVAYRDLIGHARIFGKSRAGLDGRHDCERPQFGFEFGDQTDRLGDDDDARLEGHDGHGNDWGQSGRLAPQSVGSHRPASGISKLADTNGWDARAEREQRQFAQNGGVGWMGDTNGFGKGTVGGISEGTRAECQGNVLYEDYCGAGPTNGLWANVDWLGCRDGKWRPVEPGTFPLVNGTTNRVGRLRGYGNAIVAPVAQGFIEAVMECLS